MVSRGRLLVEAIDREHRRTQALILARVEDVSADESDTAEPESTGPDAAAIHPQTWLE